jgi:hypothetical protein
VRLIGVARLSPTRSLLVVCGVVAGVLLASAATASLASFPGTGRGTSALGGVAGLAEGMGVEWSAFLANLFEELGKWWNSLSPVEQALIIVGVAAFLSFGFGFAFWPTLGYVSTASAVAEYGQGTADFMRDPRAASESFFRDLTPQDAALYAADAALGRVAPAGGEAGSAIRRNIDDAADEAADAARRTDAADAADEALDAPRRPRPETDAAAANIREGIPHGFSSPEDFAAFTGELRTGLRDAGYDDVTPIFQGSSVTGESFRTGMPFDVDRTSDFDIALASPSALERARDMGIGLRSGGTRTGPLTLEQLYDLGLGEMAESLSGRAGREVNFMLFESVDTAVVRGPSLMVP